MTLAILIMISMMWIPLGMVFLGQGEAKSAGFITALAGIFTGVGAVFQSAQGDLLTGGALFAFSILYLVVAYALLAGVEDMRTVGNAALTVAIICAVSAFLLLTGGGTKADGTTFVGVSKYLGFMFTTFTILCLSVFMNAYGKCSGKVVGWMLIILALICLLLPAYGLIGYGALPF
jgi:hypothetical protein